VNYYDLEATPAHVYADPVLGGVSAVQNRRVYGSSTSRKRSRGGVMLPSRLGATLERLSDVR
jgi:ABC-type Fe2+-enterobactin transport system substrate-binding protein